MTVMYHGTGNPDGDCFGQSGEKIAFLGGTPAAKVSLTTVASSATLATCTASLVEIIAELRSKGLVG